MSKPILRDRRKSLYGGVIFICLGTVLLWDAYDNRGISRPLLTKLLPGG